MIFDFRFGNINFKWVLVYKKLGLQKINISMVGDLMFFLG